MKTTNTLTKLANAALSAMHAEKRPQTETRSRIQSVEYVAKGMWEATDREGHVCCYLTADAVRSIANS